MTYDKSTVIIMLLCLSILSLAACTTTPTCGNGVIEQGENAATCCIDAGCAEGLLCSHNACTEPSCTQNQYLDTATHTCKDNPTCTECQYLDSTRHVCIDHACCIDADCKITEYCRDYTCEALQCNTCEYVDSHVCTTSLCCEDANCDDDIDATEDSCKSPGTKTAKCVHTVLNACTSTSNCDDDDETTKDYCSTRAPRACMHDLITECEDNDDFCPPDCTYSEDDDCSRVTTCDNDDLDCFLEELADCNEASLLLTVENNTADLNVDITTKLLIEGENSDDECEVSFTTKDVDLAFTDDYINELEDDDYTQSEIDDLEDEAQDHASDVIGYDWTCIFDNTDDLADILEDWERGDYSIRDFDATDCEGDYFG